MTAVGRLYLYDPYGADMRSGVVKLLGHLNRTARTEMAMGNYHCILILYIPVEAMPIAYVASTSIGLRINNQSANLRYEASALATQGVQVSDASF